MTEEYIISIIVLLIVAIGALLSVRYTTRTIDKRIAEMHALRDEIWPEDDDTEINPAAGCTVYNYSAVYLDADTTPSEAATMILATLGPVYVDKLIDALMDTFNSQPRDTESVKENL